MNDYKGLKGCFYITDLFIPEGKLKKLNYKMKIYIQQGSKLTRITENELKNNKTKTY